MYIYVCIYSQVQSFVTCQRFGMSAAWCPTVGDCGIFLRVLYIVTIYSKYTWALTFENSFFFCRDQKHPAPCEQQARWLRLSILKSQCPSLQ